MSSMIGIVWLADIVGVIMLAAAVSSIARMLLAWRTRRFTDYEVDGSHAVMGVSMAGMLIPGLRIVTPGSSTTIWVVVWIVISLWFVVSVARRHRAGTGAFGSHHFPHLVMSLAMVYMLAAGSAAGGSGSSTRSSSMSMGGASGLVPLVTLDLAFVLFMVGYAVVVLDRSPLGGLPQVAPPSPLLADGASLATAGPAPATSARTVVTPRVAALTNLVMAITMGYMLVLMLA